MSSPGISTWDASVPHRPGIGDFSGAVFVDQFPTPIDASTIIPASLINTQAKELCSLGSVCPNIILTISGATPAITGVATPKSNITTANFSLALSNSNGTASITWSASLYPLPATQPIVFLNSNSAANAGWTAFNIPNGIQVNTQISGSFSPIPFTVMVF